MRSALGLGGGAGDGYDDVTYPYPYFPSYPYYSGYAEPGFALGFTDFDRRHGRHNFARRRDFEHDRFAHERGRSFEHVPPNYLRNFGFHHPGFGAQRG